MLRLLGTAGILYLLAGSDWEHLELAALGVAVAAAAVVSRTLEPAVTRVVAATLCGATVWVIAPGVPGLEDDGLRGLVTAAGAILAFSHPVRIVFGPMVVGLGSAMTMLGGAWVVEVMELPSLNDTSLSPLAYAAVFLVSLYGRWMWGRRRPNGDRRAVDQRNRA